ncbi:MAG: hypothetical protein MJ234_01455 [bacterium]|nr:hypothetical protein [bacterium]
MDFLNLINGILIPSSEIGVSSGEYGIRADAKLSLSSIMHSDKRISEILPILNGAVIGNTGIYFADDRDGGKVAELEFEKIELRHDVEEGITLRGGVISLSLDCVTGEDGKKSILLSGAFLKKVTVDICQILTEKVISILKNDLEKNGIFKIKMLFHNGRIILKGEYRKSILAISFSVEFAVEAKKNNIKLSIAKINLASFGVPDFVIQNIIMEAIKKNLSLDFIKIKDNYLLVNIRQVIPAFLDYNPISISIDGGRFSLIIDGPDEEPELIPALAKPEVHELVPQEPMGDAELAKFRNNEDEDGDSYEGDD